jgi:hypothetical protein
MLKAGFRMMAFLGVGLFLASAASAAPVNFRLVRTTPLFNEDPPGAPLPLARTQYDSGDVQNAQGQKIGEYLRLKDVHAAGLNVAATTLTLFFPRGAGLPGVITMQGVHSFNTGDEAGSVSASTFPTTIDVQWTVAGATSILTINLP